MIKEIYIIGSGGFAKEVYFLIDDINKFSETPKFKFCAFIDITEHQLLSIGADQFPIITEDVFISMNKSSDTCLAIGIGDPKILEKLAEKFAGKFNFPNLIHPSVNAYWTSIKLGQANIITAGCIFTVDIEIGSFNIFNLNTTLGHDSIIGSFNVINPGVNISGGVKIGKGNLIGTNATILQYISVGDYSVLGASSLLTKNLDSNWVAIGSPAKPYKENS